MNGLIDIHCHILPGVDDGSPDMDTTREMLRMAWSDGITAMIATPHYRRGYAAAPAEKLREVYQQVAAEAKKIHPDFQIYLGNELFSSHSLPERLEQGQVLTMSGSKYVLVEFLPSVEYASLSAALRELQMNGYRPIAAHVERYACLLEEPYLVQELADMGFYIQVNAMSVTGDNGYSVKRFVRKLLKYELVHFLGTDAHGTGGRRPAMQKCVSYIEKKYGEAYASKIARDNALGMLQNKFI